MYQIRSKLLEFIGDYPIIIHELSFQIEFLRKYIFMDKNYKNEFLDSMQLAMILEPYHKDFNLNYLAQNITKLNRNKQNRALNDAMINIQVINSLILRLFKNEESRLDKLYFNLDQYFLTANLEKWEWSKYLVDIENKHDYEKYVLYENIDNKFSNNHNIDLGKYKNNYEELLKIKELWESSKDFSYTFRPRQYEFTKFIKDVYQSFKAIPKIGCIEAPTGIGKSVGYLIPAIMESLYNNKKVVISTDTKNLQMQLINKDIPTVLKSLNLKDKINYGV